MQKRYRINWKTRIIYASMIALFVSVLLIMNYAFNRSRNLLIEQETGIISQYMNRNELAVTDIMDSIRKLSAASSTDKQVASYLARSYEGDVFSSENASRIREVEDTLAFYRNIFFDYRLHYIIIGSDNTIYSVADGIDNSSYFGEQFAYGVRKQEWYQNFLDSGEVSSWAAPSAYNTKGIFEEKTAGEDFILFIRKIRDYNSQKFLGTSFVSFPVENLKHILVPYEGASLVLLNEDGIPIYTNDENGNFDGLLFDEIQKRFAGRDGHFYYEKNGRDYLLSYAVIPGSGWSLVNMVPLATITQAVDKLYGTITTVMLLIAVSALGVCLAMYVYINAPLNRLLHRVSSVNIGGRRVADVGEGSKNIFGIAEAEQEINHMVDYIERLSAQTLKQKEIEQSLRYEMLRAQLNPHFLFNTLNVIKWSAMISGAGNIGDMIASLGVLLENTMNRGKEESTLFEEIKVVKAWVEIKNWALKNRIQIHVDMPEELRDFSVIRFFLQPIVENAVLHGMKEAETGEIWIKAENYGERVCVTIQDNGSGIEQEKLEKILEELDAEHKRRHVTGIGLTSINKLMKLRYGEEYGLHIESQKGYGTKVYVIFPGKESGICAEGNDCR